jgi:hypothetical protein
MRIYLILILQRFKVIPDKDYTNQPGFLLTERLRQRLRVDPRWPTRSRRLSLAFGNNHNPGYTALPALMRYSCDYRSEATPLTPASERSRTTPLTPASERSRTAPLIPFLVNSVLHSSRKCCIYSGESPNHPFLTP